MDGGNWYLYCRNNPLRYVDPSGKNTREIALSLAPLTLCDGPFPIADILYVAIVGGSAIIEYGPLILMAKDATADNLAKKEPTIESESNGKERSFSDKLKDIQENPNDWELNRKSVEESTKKGNKGGRSIEEEYVNKKTGEKIWKHILERESGNILEPPHYRPYPKQIN